MPQPLFRWFLLGLCCALLANAFGSNLVCPHGWRSSFEGKFTPLLWPVCGLSKMLTTIHLPLLFPFWGWWRSVTLGAIDFLIIYMNIVMQHTAFSMSTSAISSACSSCEGKVTPSCSVFVLYCLWPVPKCLPQFPPLYYSLFGLVEVTLGAIDFLIICTNSLMQHAAFSIVSSALHFDGWCSCYEGKFTPSCNYCFCSVLLVACPKMLATISQAAAAAGAEQQQQQQQPQQHHQQQQQL